MQVDSMLFANSIKVSLIIQSVLNFWGEELPMVIEQTMSNWRTQVPSLDGKNWFSLYVEFHRLDLLPSLDGIDFTGISG